MKQRTADSLIKLFNELFSDNLNTILVRGEDEPIYLPADDQHPQHRIIFAHGFFASALHEISHWCVAGDQRRLLIDFGYWYKPDGRSAAEQAEFEQVEIKPQALEWLLSVAAGHKFHFSADNLGANMGASDSFKENVHQQVMRYLNEGLPERPAQLIQTLQAYYGTSPLTPALFSLQDK
ncbi:elongation factor P hydroxylase [Amphritea sp. 1_MG-2023]|uniref:elongation factor P hydroxylase n=1 Tax=Amphritea sp. 1_MG-2023 TaxID=3062670 RepID=UPI0026E41EF6|nr:elongation factor P hydroxylase [Amphritea sp. 1_MG-2023]MDO6564950.1 elongation factor P hydroxylase [Amphritea sp. 1_MG-2023]